ncbi:MAG: hypothetical protein IPJ31_11985 [Bacteroidetes bacterium]|nr:hypothetical protein [Bacteroidota bacterium]
MNSHEYHSYGITDIRAEALRPGDDIENVDTRLPSEKNWQLHLCPSDLCYTAKIPLLMLSKSKSRLYQTQIVILISTAAQVDTGQGSFKDLAFRLPVFGE